MNICDLTRTECAVVLKMTWIRKSGDRARITADLARGYAFSTWGKVVSKMFGVDDVSGMKVQIATDSLLEKGVIVRGSERLQSIAAGNAKAYFLTKLGHLLAKQMGRVQGRYGWRPLRGSDLPNWEPPVLGLLGRFSGPYARNTPQELNHEQDAFMYGMRMAAQNHLDAV